MSTSLQSVVLRPGPQGVRCRLWIELLPRGLLAGWAGALVLAMIYFIIYSVFWGPASSHGWIVLGLAVALGSVIGVIWAWKRYRHHRLRPGAGRKVCLAAARRHVPWLDAGTGTVARRPGLAGGCPREADRARRRRTLPLFRITWPQIIRPVLAGSLALLAFFFCPQINFSWADPKDPDKEARLANAEEAKRELENLKKELEKNQKDVPLSKEEKELEDKLAKLLERDPDLKDEKPLRETLDQTRAMEEKLKERIDDLKDQTQKNKLALDAMAKLNSLPKFKDGPGKDFDDALARGDFKKAAEEFEKWAREMKQEDLGKDLLEALEKADKNKAAEELDRLQKKLKQDDVGREFEEALARGDMKKAAEELDKLQKKLKNNELSRRQVERLAERMQDLQNQLLRLHDNQDVRDELARLLEKELADGKITEEEKERLERQLDRELAELKDDLADLKELANLLEDVKKGLLDKNGDELKEQLEKLKAQLAKLGKLDRGELGRLQAEQGASRLHGWPCCGPCKGQVKATARALVEPAPAAADVPMATIRRGPESRIARQNRSRLEEAAHHRLHPRRHLQQDSREGRRQLFPAGRAGSLAGDREATHSRRRCRHHPRLFPKARRPEVNTITPRVRSTSPTSPRGF